MRRLYTGLKVLICLCKLEIINDIFRNRISTLLNLKKTVDQYFLFWTSLRKHAYSNNYIENFTSKNWKFSDKNPIFFIFLHKNIGYGYSLEPPQRGGSNEYPQSMFLSRNKKNNVYPCKPQFYYIKVGFKGVELIQACFRDVKVTDCCAVPRFICKISIAFCCFGFAKCLLVR